MRKLSPQFISDLKGGFLNPLLRAAVTDRDLILSIREDGINIYFKGNSLFALSRKANRYKLSIHDKFRTQSIKTLTHLSGPNDVTALVTALPCVKEKIIALRQGGNEIEFEQMLIRANNAEPRLATDYVIIDRQVVTRDRQGRLDLTGVYLPRGTWYRRKELPLALFEIKFGLNKDVGAIHQQLQGYYDAVAANIDDIAKESECLLRQQVELGLISQSKGRLRAFKCLSVSRDIKKTRFVIILVDYAPASTLLNRAALDKLAFAGQIDIFRLGFGLWQAHAERP